MVTKNAAAGRRSSLIVRAAGSTFGHSFRVTTFGESHGGGVGCVVDGVPPRLTVNLVSNRSSRIEKPTANLFYVKTSSSFAPSRG